MYSAELKETALALIADGKPAVEVARELDIPPGTLATWKAAAGKAPKRKAKRGPRDAEKFAKLRERTAELRAKGKTQIQIAEKLGVSKSSVARWSLEAEAEAEAKTAAKAKPKPKLTAAKPKPVERTNPAPGPEPSAEYLAAAEARRQLTHMSQTVLGHAGYELRVGELQGRLEAITIERDALRRALDRITTGA
jgi:DNA-binding CsgD family transcriptional regulator